MNFGSSPHALPAMKIAFLEDDAAFAATIIEWLEQAGHDVTWFRSGRECVRCPKGAMTYVCSTGCCPT